MIDKISNALPRSKVFQHRGSKFIYLLTVLFAKAYRLYVHRTESRRATYHIGSQVDHNEELLNRLRLVVYAHYPVNGIYMIRLKPDLTKFRSITPRL
jgi:hypothetical protein